MCKECASLKDLIIRLNSINNEYCDLYYMFFSQKLFDNINYQFFLDKLAILRDLLDSNYTDAQRFSTEANFDPIIYEYIENRCTSISYLYNLVDNLSKKQKNIIHYRFFAYHKDLKKLEHIEAQAPIIGDKLQYVAEKIILSD